MAVFDVLGFKELLARKGTAWVSARYALFVERIQELCQWEVRAQVFSDTILLYGRTLEVVLDDLDSPEVAGVIWHSETTSFLGFCASAITTGLTLGMPLRAGIAYGDCFVVPDRQVFVGQAIVDAHQVESAQAWCGIALHPSTFAWMGGSEPQDGDFWRLTRFDVPLKARASALRLEWSVNWSTLGLGRAQLASTLDAYQAANRGGPHEEWWTRTREFYDYCIAQPPERGGFGAP